MGRVKPDAGFARELRALSEEFRAGLPRTIDGLQTLWQEIQAERIGAERLRDVHRGLHSLAGSASTFGMPSLGVAAAAAEAWIEDFSQRLVVPRGPQCAEFVRLLAAVSDAAADPGASVPAPALDTLGRQTHPAMPVGPQAISPHGRKVRVLLAEDTRLVQMVAASLLVRHGCEVVVANDGSEALAAWAREPFDLVLMDVQMPGMDGLAAAAAIREGERGSTARVPIVAVTADGALRERERCRAAGMDECIAKPLDGTVLADLIRRHVRGSRPRER